MLNSYISKRNNVNTRRPEGTGPVCIGKDYLRAV